MKDQSILTDNFPPPPFATTRVPPDLIKRMPNEMWWPLTKLKYENCSLILNSDFHLLEQIITVKWKQQAVRLEYENAMILSEGLANRAGHWNRNVFYKKLMHFKSGFPDGIGNGEGTVTHLPTYQWLQWMIYMLLRDAVILAEMKLDCENSMEIWLGHIAAGHHVEDSIFVSSIISRIWYLSSVMVDELNSKIYPFLLHLTRVVRPVRGSRPWPDSYDSWKVPNPKDNFLAWLRDTFNVSFQPASMNQKLWSILKRDNGWIVRLLEANDAMNDSVESEAASDSEVADNSTEKNVRTNAKDHKKVKPGATTINVKIKSEPAEPSSSSVKQDDAGISSGSESDEGIHIYPAGLGVKIKSEPPDLAQIVIVEDDSSSSESSDVESKEEVEEDPAPSKRSKLNPGTPGPGASTSDSGTTTWSVNPPELDVPEQIKDIRQFSRFWANMFSVLYELDPKTAAGREEMLRHIWRYNYPPERTFSDEYWEKFYEFKQLLVRLHEAVQGYGSGSSRSSTSSHDKFIARIKQTETEIGNRLKKLKTKCMPPPSKIAARKKYGKKRIGNGKHRQVKPKPNKP